VLDLSISFKLNKLLLEAKKNPGASTFEIHIKTCIKKYWILIYLKRSCHRYFLQQDYRDCLVLFMTYQNMYKKVLDIIIPSKILKDFKE
jgi:hypothetical protein